MSRKIRSVAIQMDAALAPTEERLARAEKLILEANPEEADLILLPELFNTGYGYVDENFQRAETLEGVTVAWMKDCAAKYDIHLGGSLMLWDEGEIYNAMLLFAPDGRMWRYDKNYPWGWERGYFRERKGITIAETDLGDFGMLVCWDVAHPQLWAGYAGKADMMLISSCPPDVTNPTFHFPQKTPLTFDDFGFAGKQLKDTGQLLFGEMVDQQSAWLGVPAIQTVGSGHLRTRIPRGVLSMLSYLPVAPKLLGYLAASKDASLESDFVEGCKILDAEGKVQAKVTQVAGESFARADVQIAASKPKPGTQQPKSLLPKLTYLASDLMLPLIMRPFYRKKVRDLGKERG